MIGALCKGGKLDEAIMMFSEMMAAGCTPDEVVSATVYGNLFMAGRLYEAQQLFNRMENKDMQMYLIITSNNLLCCSTCKTVHYCSIVCQKFWPPFISRCSKMVFILGSSGRNS